MKYLIVCLALVMFGCGKEENVQARPVPQIISVDKDGKIHVPYVPMPVDPTTGPVFP